MSDPVDDLELDALERQWAEDLTAEAGPQAGDAGRLSDMIDHAVQSAPAAGGAGASTAGTSTGTLIGIGAIIVAAVAVVSWPSDYVPGELHPYVREQAPVEPELEPTAEAEVDTAAPNFQSSGEPTGARGPDPAVDGVVSGAPAGTTAPGRSPLTATPAAPEMSAADLFAQANEARRKRNYDEAIRLYHRLHRLHKSSREAQVSRVALARVLLDEKNEPRRALRLFEHYLRSSPTGSLAEEAKAGRALAFQKLGRKDEEREAWQEFLEEHPSSAYSAKARARLGALGSPTPG